MCVLRQAILKAKASARGVEVPEAVLTYIAEHLRASIRELEGALYTVIAQAVLTGRRIDLSLAQSALRDSIRHTTVSIGLRDIERVVCNLFQVKAEATQIRQPHPGTGLSAHDRHVHVPQAHRCRLQRDRALFRRAQPRDSHVGRTEGREMAAIGKANRPAAGFETVADLLYNLERALGTTS